MNGWIAVLLLADLVGTAIVVVRVYRAEPLDGTPRDLERRDLRKIQVTEAGVDGALFAVIILGLHSLGLWSALGLAFNAMIAGRACRLAVAFHTVLDDPIGRRFQGMTTALAVVTTAVVPLTVVVSAASAASHRTQAQRDTSLFGVHVSSRETDVPTRVLAHPPVAADSGLADGIVVPVEKYHAEIDGTLVLLVPHELTCLPAEVLLARDSQLGAIDVAVVYRPSWLTRMPDGSLRGTATPTALPDTSSPETATPTPTGGAPSDATASPSPSSSPLPASVCRTDAGHGIPERSTIQVSIPRDLLPPAVDEPNMVRDTGADGAALEVTGGARR
ncbi:MAG: hypothetical protein ACJ73S_06845 [Mycobacteriales bacterium]